MSSISKVILSYYRIIRILGKGTFSTVKLAIDMRTNGKIAIKILEKNKIQNCRDYNRINREINIVKKINHLNIVQVFEIKEDFEKIYILMEYCERGELFDLILSKKKLTEEESAYYFYQLVNGLEYLHLNNIIHRDLKPENLLLTKNNILKIIDFGLSNFNTEDNLLSTPCGSPCYASPEMVSGKKYNGFTNDIWSIGIILYAMIYGYLPFENTNNNNILLFSKIRECKIDYPKNNCLLALDLLKRILVPDYKQRIAIDDIKRHKFYLKGKVIFKRKFREINLENNFVANIRKNMEENKINRVREKYSLSEINSGLNEFNNNKNNLLNAKNCNIQIEDENIGKYPQKIYNNTCRNNLSPENMRITEYQIRSQSKKMKGSYKEKNYFPLSTRNNMGGRLTFNNNITANTEKKLNPNINNQHYKRKNNFILMHPNNIEYISKTKNKTRMKPKKEDPFQSPNIIDFSDKFPDFNSLSYEKEKSIFNEYYSNIKQKNKNENKENKEKYVTSEIKKIISDNYRRARMKFKEIKQISAIDLKYNNDFVINKESQDKKEINYNYRGKYEKNRLKHEIIENNNQNINLNNVLNISNDYIRNKKYNNTFIHVPNLKNVNSNPKSIKNKYLIMDNNNSLRNKFSEDEINKRIETSFGKNNNSNTHTYIISQRNTTKKFSHANIQSSSNFSSKNNNINNSRRKDNKRQNKIHNGKNEESKEKEQSIYIKNKVIIYPNKNINENKNYRYNNDSYKYKYEKSNYHRNNRKNHGTYTYIHKNSNEIKNKNMNNNINYDKYKIYNNKDSEEISKINNSYDNYKSYDENSKRKIKTDKNINKINKNNFPSITIDMSVLNKNNNKYLKFYDSIKNKL